MNDRPRPPPPSGAIALLALVLSCVAGVGSAHHHRQSSGGAPGDFAYYLLSLSWSPAFCLGSPDADECNGPRQRK